MVMPDKLFVCIANGPIETIGGEEINLLTATTNRTSHDQTLYIKEGTARKELELIEAMFNELKKEMNKCQNCPMSQN